MAVSETEEIRQDPTPLPHPRPPTIVYQRPRLSEFQELPPSSPITRPVKPTIMVRVPKSNPGWWGGGRWCGFPICRVTKKGKEPACAAKVVDAPRRCVARTRGLAWATNTTIGKRVTMEDFHTSLRGFARMGCGEFGGCTAPDSACSRALVPMHYFGVYDGHQGSEVGNFCANMLHRIILREWKKRASEEVVEWRERWKTALTRAFEIADETVKVGSLIPPIFTGSTATVVALSPCQIIASNCGDSRAILCRSQDVIPLTVDHKPHVKEEAKRIKKSGGRIFKHKGLRVEGVLSKTRAIGAHDLKRYVISKPDVSFTSRSDDDECLIIATDGLWDVMSSEKVAKFARMKLVEYRSSLPSSSSTPAAMVSKELVYKALAKKSQDNITVLVVDLKPLRRRN